MPARPQQWHAAKLSAIAKRGPWCEICGTEKATDAHHALIPRMKRYAEFLDTEVNCELLCHECHMMGLGDTLEHRREFYIKQVNRYGLAVQEWIDGLPYKLKLTHRLDFLS